MTRERLVIERLGQRGEGVARGERGLVFVPYALAGETVLAETDGEHARLLEILEPSQDRIAPTCPHYMVCGGCAVQTLAPAAYADWKRELVVGALRNAGLDATVAPLIDAHGEGRRRVTFHARMEAGRARVGFMRARSHEIVEIGACPLLAPGLAGALPAARAVAQALAEHGKPLDIVASCTLDGLDVDLRGAGALAERELSALIDVAEAHDLARLSNHGRLVALRRRPRIAIGGVRVTPPPGAFLQATQAGEAAIARIVEDATMGAKRVADLFCGLGAFALRLAARSSVAAYDNDAGAVEALCDAARAMARPAAHRGSGARFVSAALERRGTRGIRRDRFRSAARGRAGASVANRAIERARRRRRVLQRADLRPRRQALDRGRLRLARDDADRPIPLHAACRNRRSVRRKARSGKKRPLLSR